MAFPKNLLHLVISCSRGFRSHFVRPSRRCFSIQQVLLEANSGQGGAVGAEDVDSISMVQDGKGCTPLHHAAMGASAAHIECAKLLAAAAPRALRVENKAREAPFDCCTQWRVVAALPGRGARGRKCSHLILMHACCEHMTIEEKNQPPPCLVRPA